MTNANLNVYAEYKVQRRVRARKSSKGRRKRITKAVRSFIWLLRSIRRKYRIEIIRDKNSILS